MAKQRRKLKAGPSGGVSARQMRDRFINSRWRIFRAAPTYGGLFRSYDPLATSEDPGVSNSWMDIWFLGLDGRTTWGAGVQTARTSFEGAVSRLASERTQALLTEEEYQEEFRMEREAVFEDGKKLWSFKFPGERPRVALGGLTFRAYQEKLKAEIRAQEPPVIHECFQISPDHGYIDIVVDAPLLDRATIEQAILRFRALGEKDWTSPDPVPPDRLRGEGGQAAS